MRAVVRALSVLFAVPLSLPAWSQAGRTQEPSQAGPTQESSQPSDAQGGPQSGRDTSKRNRAPDKVPEGVLLIKGAWSSASDSTTPLPEGGSVGDNAYSNPYFGLTYPVPKGWIQRYEGPPPSDSGYYVLAQLTPAPTTNRSVRGSILIRAQDLFFALTPTADVRDLIRHTTDRLQADYKVERPPTEVSVAKHSFIRYDYFSPAAQLHWYTLATQIRCHMVEFVFTSHDTKLMESFIEDMNTMKLPAEAGLSLRAGGDEVPVCIKDYARGDNVIERVDPILVDRHFNPIPVRVIIDKNGKVRHIHFISAYPDQTQKITEALNQWQFRPYMQDGHPVEVETGIMFGHPPRSAAPRSAVPRSAVPRPAVPH